MRPGNQGETLKQRNGWSSLLLLLFWCWWRLFVFVPPVASSIWAWWRIDDSPPRSMLGGKRKFVVCEKCSEQVAAIEQWTKPWLFRFILGVILPSLIGISRSCCKDAQQPISIMQCHKGFEHCSIDLLFSLGVGGVIKESVSLSRYLFGWSND